MVSRILISFGFLVGVFFFLFSFSVVYGVRGIFETLNTANRIDEEVIGDADPRLNVGKLNEAHDAVFKRQLVPLDLKN